MTVRVAAPDPPCVIVPKVNCAFICVEAFKSGWKTAPGQSDSSVGLSGKLRGDRARERATTSQVRNGSKSEMCFHDWGVLTKRDQDVKHEAVGPGEGGNSRGKRDRNCPLPLPPDRLF